MRISTVILSFNSSPYLERTLRAAIAALNDTAEPDEIWVVENGSTDSSPTIARRLAAEFPKVLRVIECPVNQGTTVSRNLALRRTTGRYLLVVDSDVVEIPGATIHRLLQVVDADPSCGIVAPRLVYPDGRFQLSTDTFPTIGRKLHRFLRLRSIEQTAAIDQTPTRPMPVDYAISAFWLLRRDVLERVGFFDERIFYSPEDVDYCLRVWQSGLRVLYDPSVFAVHDAREISRGFKRPSFMFSHAKGLAYLFVKHRYGLGRRRLYARLSRGAGK